MYPLSVLPPALWLYTALPPLDEPSDSPKVVSDTGSAWVNVLVPVPLLPTASVPMFAETFRVMFRLIASLWVMNPVSPTTGTPPSQLLATFQFPSPLNVQERLDANADEA